MTAPKVLSLYTGAGGLDLGMEAAGFKHIAAIEMDADAVATVRQNRDWLIIHAKLLSEEAARKHKPNGTRAMTAVEFVPEASIVPREPDLLVGGPPCQPFSKAGYWATGDSARLDDPRADTLTAYLDVLRLTLPRAFLLENVPGMSFSDKSEGLQFLRSAIARINREEGTSYSITAKQLNAVEYGVPQIRERVIVIGHREGKSFEFPSPTHAKPGRVDMANGGVIQHRGPQESLEPALTAWDALGGLGDDSSPELQPQGKWAALLPTIPEGQNYLFHTDRGGGLPLFGWRRRYWSMLLKLSKTLPSWTITAQPGPAIGPFHWCSRRLSSRELCALQTFPEGYEIIGSVRSAYRQLGNAVPSALAEVLGLEIRRQLLGHDVPQRLPSLIPTRRASVPPAEAPAEVPEQYLGLVGEHEEHPGKGLGPGATARQARS